MLARIAVKPKSLFLVLIGIMLAACSFQPPDANGPRANARPYPVILGDEEARSARLLAWKNLSTARGMATPGEPRFNPFTGTLESLPTGGAAQVILPRVGAGPTPSEDEIRESLRRFISDW